MTRNVLLASLLGLLANFLPAQDTGLLPAQNAVLRGRVTDADNNRPLADASVVLSQTGLFAATTAEGLFVLENVPPGQYTLIVTAAGYLPHEQSLEVKKGADQTIDVPMRADQIAPAAAQALSTDIPTITLDEAEAETEGAGEVANLLHANRDMFQNVAAFGWFVFRFRERGYESEHFPVYLNGVSINDPETGIAFFGEFGGLNDVLRIRESVIGLDAAGFAFSNIGGATNIDTRASVQRKQIRATYAISNRAYNHRVMLTANTGLMPGGWAVSLSGSKRWAEEGWYDGTFFDGYSYFLSVDKKFGQKHALNLTFLGAPSRRGRNSDTFQEMYDLAGTTRYNPNWGYWNGEKRNASITHSHQPIGLLRYDWTPNPRTGVTVTAYGQAGKRGFSRLDWFNATNPAPDFNRRLPSSLEDSTQAAQWAEALRNDESLRQIDWAGIYAGNTNGIDAQADANGIPDNTVTGNRSTVVLADFREDSREAGFHAVARRQLTNRIALNGGVSYLWYEGRNFKVVEDMLGGDFIVDINPFAQRDVPENPAALNNDLRTPNRIVREGETFGWDYDENILRAGAWAQVRTDLRRFSFFASGEFSQTQLWRVGHMQNGRFPDNSLGESAKLTFNTYGVKAGATFKATGRHYLYVNGFQGTRAPQFRDLFISPRTRNDAIPGIEVSTVQSVEGGYLLRAPRLRARLTGYATHFGNETETLILFGQVSNVFGTEVRTGVDHLHTGIEAAAEWKATAALSFAFATNLGYYRYTSRPVLSFFVDNTAEAVIEEQKVYQEGYLVPRTPQTAATAAVRYEGRDFWFTTLSFNWTDDFWYEFDRARRMADYATQVRNSGIQPGSDAWNSIMHQAKAPSAYTLDFFGGKSWRVREKYFVYFNAGVNNILDNRDIITSGREAYFRAFRDVEDLRQYSNELTYATGINYFISLGVRM